MKHIQLFEDFIFEDEDGYGRDFFVKKKDGKVLRYFFKMEGEEDTLCFIINIGKSSRKITIESSENSYGVISVEPIKQSVMDDYLVNDTDYKTKTDQVFDLSNSEFMRFYRILGEAIKDYLENNPKVSMLYDEIPLNLNIEPEEYLDKVKNLMGMWSYEKWGAQEGSSSQILIYIRRNHE